MDLEVLDASERTQDFGKTEHHSSTRKPCFGLMLLTSGGPFRSELNPLSGSFIESSGNQLSPR